MENDPNMAMAMVAIGEDTAFSEAQVRNQAFSKKITHFHGFSKTRQSEICRQVVSPSIVFLM
jgi:hypothetical protein